MKYTNIIFLIFLITSGAFACEGNTQKISKLTRICINAFEDYSHINNSSDFKPFSVQLRGCVGDELNFQCVHKIKINFEVGSNGNIIGKYQSVSGGRKIVKFKGKISHKGDLFLKRESGGSGYIFKGKFSNLILAGLWEKGQGKKGYSFYGK